MMTDTKIEQLRVPDSLEGADAADFLRAVEVSRQVRINTWGNDELAYTPQELFEQCHDPYEWYVVLVGRKNGEIVGRAGIAMPLDDNTELAHVTLDILPEAEGLGLGRQLLEAAETFVKGENRRIVVVETNHAAAALGNVEADPITATHGTGVLPLGNRQARFAYSAGYDLDQVEQFSSCALPLDKALVADLSAQGVAAHERAYAVHQWLDACPEQWASEIARLEQSQGAGDVDEPWDVAKLRQAEELSAASGRRSIVTAAEFLETGKLVAFTSISLLGKESSVAFQDDTVVEVDHRGKKVGLSIKVANMELLMREFPQAKTIYTWNAPENSHLLEVNAQLGFVSAGVTGQWRKDFNAM